MNNIYKTLKIIKSFDPRLSKTLNVKYRNAHTNSTLIQNQYKSHPNRGFHQTTSLGLVLTPPYPHNHIKNRSIKRIIMEISECRISYSFYLNLP